MAGNRLRPFILATLIATLQVASGMGTDYIIGANETGDISVASSALIGFHGKDMDVQLKDGLVYSLVSGEDHQVNAEFTSVGEEDTTLVLTKVGALLPDEVTIAVWADVESYQEWRQGEKLNPAEVETSVRDFVCVFICGADYSARLGTDLLLTYDKDQGSVVFPQFKSSLHDLSTTAFPVIVAKSIFMELTVLVQFGETVHLELLVDLEPVAKMAPIHGLLGQTFRWPADSALTTALQGTEQDYVLPDLLSSMELETLLKGRGASHGSLPELMEHTADIKREFSTAQVESAKAKPSGYTREGNVDVGWHDGTGLVEGASARPSGWFRSN